MPNNFPDWTGTWTDVLGFAGKTPWFTENWSALVERTEDIAGVIDTATAGYTTLNARHLAHEVTTTEVVAARNGYGSLLLKQQAQDTATTSVTNEVNTARDGYGSLLLKQQAQDTLISQKLSEASGLTQNLDGNTYRAVDFSNAVDLQDLTTLSQVNAIAAGGGSPSAIPITDLNVGTATANQKIKVDGAGTAIIGVDDVQDITGLEVGTATADQIIKINGIGDAVIGQDQYDFPVTGFSPGTGTANQLLRVSSDGNNVIGDNQSSLGITGFNVGSATASQRLEINSGGTAIIGVSPVRYSANRGTQVLAASSPVGQAGGTFYLPRSVIVESEYALGCSSNTSGTNLVTLPSGVYLVTITITFYKTITSNYYQYSLMSRSFVRIDSSVGFIDGVGSHFSQNGFIKENPPTHLEYGMDNYLNVTTQRIVNVSSSAVIGLTAGSEIYKSTTGVAEDIYIHSSNVSIYKI